MKRVLTMSLPCDGAAGTYTFELIDAREQMHPVDREAGCSNFWLTRNLFTFILASENRIHGQGWSYLLKPGDGLLITEGESFQAHYGRKATLEVINVLFRTRRGDKRRLLNMLPRLVTAREDTTAIRRSLEGCAHALRRHNDALATAEFASLLVELAKTRLRAKELTLSRPVKNAIEFVRTYCATAIRRRDVADACAVSPAHLSYLIRKETGLTLTDHITRARVERAKELMHGTTKNFSEIADALGMDLYSFSRLFKRVTGISPTGYCKAAPFAGTR